MPRFVDASEVDARAEDGIERGFGADHFGGEDRLINPGSLDAEVVLDGGSNRGFQRDRNHGQRLTVKACPHRERGASTRRLRADFLQLVQPRIKLAFEIVGE